MYTCITRGHGIAWWRYQMEAFSTLLALCAGNSPVTNELPSQRPVTRSFDVFFDLRLNIRFVNNHEAGDLRLHRSCHCNGLYRTNGSLSSSKTTFKYLYHFHVEWRYEMQRHCILIFTTNNLTCWSRVNHSDVATQYGIIYLSQFWFM